MPLFERWCLPHHQTKEGTTLLCGEHHFFDGSTQVNVTSDPDIFADIEKCTGAETNCAKDCFKAPPFKETSKTIRNITFYGDAYSRTIYYYNKFYITVLSACHVSIQHGAQSPPNYIFFNWLSWACKGQIYVVGFFSISHHEKQFHLTRLLSKYVSNSCMLCHVLWGGKTFWLS